MSFLNFLLNKIYCFSSFEYTIFLILIVSLYTIANIFLTSKLTRKITSIIFMLFTVFLILYITIFARNVGIYKTILIPFGFFIEARRQPEFIRTFFMNILFFVPLGLSFPYVLSKKAYKRNVFITVGFAAVLSAGIEFLQYYYHLGRCETDDVIANTLGAAVGTLSYLLYMKILKNQEKGSLMQKINNNQTILLDLCAKSLFGKDITIPDEVDSKELIEESKRQTVFPTTYSFIKDKSTFPFSILSTISSSEIDSLFSEM